MNIRKAALFLLIAAFGWLSMKTLGPFLVYVLGAMVLAFIVRPIYNGIIPLIGENLSAGLMVLCSILVVLLPVAFISILVVDDAQEVISQVNETQIVDLENLETRFKEITGQDIDLTQNLEQAIEYIFSLAFFGNFASGLGVLGNISIGLTIVLFLEYYLVRDGEGLVRWMLGVYPLPESIQSRLIRDAGRITMAVLRGHIMVAIIQGLVAGLGVFIVGISNYFFWTFVMIILSFIPIIGSIGVWGPASLYLFFSGSYAWGGFLLLYGVLVVSFTDNFLRPLLIDKSVKLHPAVIFLGVVGGIFVYGAVGVFLGPLVLGLLQASLTVFRDHYTEL
ncbi:AI-2E family transporter [Candidatus Bathyarchaeota archaeon]|nr:AI-2E family transporter [Candidatus Bathyarchaeota archaeon]